ncbi:MAG TPA: hypothetical protein VFF06_33300 [Polyangia bacterium]|nr:hypothetical protein [Polyangia bacterium]
MAENVEREELIESMRLDLVALGRAAPDLVKLIDVAIDNLKWAREAIAQFGERCHSVAAEPPGSDQ